MATKRFSLGTVLSVTTGRLLTEPKGERDNGISDMYELLNHMTGDLPYTHQLVRFAGECKPWLLRWFPELAQADVHLGELDHGIESVKAAGKDVALAIHKWLDRCVVDLGMNAEYEIGPIPADDHDVIDPHTELVTMGVDPDKIVRVETQEQEGERDERD